ncbi:hypothetical protein BI330_12175 [Mycobacterium sp. CBMA 623]|nr:hypothetical protein [Mycobacteroides sp. CBMA 326]
MSTPAPKLQFDLFAAAIRALESQRGHPLINDPLARVLVEAANEPLSTALLAAGFPENPSGTDGTFLLINAAGVLIRDGDDFIAAELESGTRQIVLCAAGLDTRAYRLTWPEDAVLYEVDYPYTLEFTTRVLRDHGVVAGVTHRQVATTGVSEAWPESLCAVGFDPEQPTAWLIHPLIMTGMAPTDQDALFEHLIELSAPGSAISGDADSFLPSIDVWDSLAEPVVPETIRDANLWMGTYPEARMRPSEWLTGHGWITQVRTMAEICEDYGRPFTEDVPEIVKGHANWQFLTARLPPTESIHQSS